MEKNYGIAFAILIISILVITFSMVFCHLYKKLYALYGVSAVTTAVSAAYCTPEDGFDLSMLFFFLIVFLFIFVYMVYLDKTTEFDYNIVDEWREERKKKKKQREEMKKKKESNPDEYKKYRQKTKEELSKELLQDIPLVVIIICLTVKIVDYASVIMKMYT